jgi:Rad3-related DNA helicase
MLIDDRFAESRIQQLLPRWWAIKNRPDGFSIPRIDAYSSA